ncbi:hypothetical protein ACFQ7J_15600 [Streptomyces sp. NPDC056501]|uniref:hypothetical protein n=1 Tax=Streptomyces sp. NPDC056501 TaxID=3345841 RepID=UPI00369C8626
MDTSWGCLSVVPDFPGFGKASGSAFARLIERWASAGALTAEVVRLVDAPVA